MVLMAYTQQTAFLADMEVIHHFFHLCFQAGFNGNRLLYVDKEVIFMKIANSVVNSGANYSYQKDLTTTGAGTGGVRY